MIRSKLKTTLPWVAAFAAAAAAATASAAPVEMSGSFSNLQVSVSDLAPDDPNVPAPVSAGDIEANSSVWAHPYSGTYSWNTWWNASGQDSLSAGQVSGSWQVAADHRSASNSVQLAEQGSGGSYTAFSTDLWLAPYSSITVSGHFDAAWQGVQEDFLSGHVLGQVVFWARDASLPFTQFNMRIDEPGTEDRDFSITWTNDTDRFVSAEMSYGLYVGYEDDGMPPPPVPEPAAYAMMGAGVVVLAAWKRRRPDSRDRTGSRQR